MERSGASTWKPQNMELVFSRQSQTPNYLTFHIQDPIMLGAMIMWTALYGDALYFGG